MKKIYFETHTMDKNPVIYCNDTLLEKNHENYLTGFNWHKNIELILIKDGSGHILCDAKTYCIEKGDLFIFNSNELHSFYTTNFLLYDCLIIDSNFLVQNEIHVTNLRFDNLIHSANINSLYEEIAREVTSNDDFKNVGIRTKVLQLFLDLLRNHCTESTNQNLKNTTVDSIKCAINFINNNYDRKITLDEIATVSGISKYHLAREFKKLTNLTVTSYLNTVRCNHAKLLILTKNYSVHAAALSCGFTNASFFTKTFHKLMGYLPSEIKAEQDS